jgi:penicillin-binding protein 2
MKRVTPEIINQFKLSKKTSDIIRQSLFDVVNTAGGTATSLKGVGIQMAGKTGTAQVMSFSADKIFNKCENQEYKFRHHALFAGFAPAANPKIAVAVVVEHGCHGGSAAGPVAKAMVAAFMNKYYSKYQGKIMSQDKMNYAQILEDNRLNPVPMELENTDKTYFDDTGTLVKNYMLGKSGAVQDLGGD